MTISAVLIAKNEALKIEDCLKSLVWADEIVVVDTDSRDGTAEIAKKYGAKVFNKPFHNFSDQKNYGIDQAACDWILSIDADERVSPQLQESLKKIDRTGSDKSGYFLTRINYIFGKRFRFGGNGPEKILRFFKKEKGRFEQPIHEKVVLEGDAGEVEGELIHVSTNSLSDYERKLSLYTDHEAKWMMESGMQVNFANLWIKPFVRLFYFYIVKMGILDGWKGLRYHLLSAYYFHLKYKKLGKLLAK